VSDLGGKAFIVRLIFTPKTGSGTVAFTRHYTAVIEVLNDLVHRKQSDSANQNLREEKTIALDLARQAALSTFATSGEQIARPYDEDALWYEERPHVMDERPCDHEEGGVKVWKMAEGPGTV
jgi:hypothetical protein